MTMKSGKAKPGTSTVKPPADKKPTNAELEERYEQAAIMLAQGMFLSTIRRELNLRYRVSRATADRYVSRAKEILAEQDTEKTPTEYRRESIAMYKSVIADPNASIRDKLRAQFQLDRVTLTTRTKIQFADADGRTLSRDEIETTVDNLAEIIIGSGESSSAETDSGDS